MGILKYAMYIYAIKVYELCSQYSEKYVVKVRQAVQLVQEKGVQQCL